MSLPKKLANYLQKNQVPYEIVEQPAAFTSQKTAQAVHLPGARMAKAVMVNIRERDQERDVMMVLPADHVVDFLKLGILLGVRRKLRMEEEYEFQHLFPDSETGAMPPFGELYEIPCFVDNALLKGEYVAFNGGNHHECLCMRTADFIRVLKAKQGDFSVRRASLRDGSSYRAVRQRVP